jgi:hypothetical protein
VQVAVVGDFQLRWGQGDAQPRLKLSRRHSGISPVSRGAKSMAAELMQ